MRRLAILGLIAASACSRTPRNLEVSASDLPDFEVAFPIVAGDSGTPRAILPPIAIHGGRITSGSPSMISAHLDEESILLAGLDVDTLSTAAPMLARALTASIALELAPPPAAPRRIRDPNGAVRDELALPASIALLQLDEGTSRFKNADDAIATSLRDAVTLELPIDPEACGPGSTAIAKPFGTAPELLTGSEFSDARLHRVIRVDEDRVLAISRAPGTIYLLTKNDPPNHPSALFDLTLFTGFFTEAGGLVLDPVPRADGSLRVLVAAEHQNCPSDDCKHGKIYELRIAGTTLELVDTATTTLGRPLLDVAIDRRRRAIAVGKSNTVLTTHPGLLDFQLRPELPVFSLERAILTRVIATSNEMTPHFVGGAFRVFLGDADAGSWTPYELDEGIASRLRTFGLAEADAGELWSLGESTTIYRGTAGTGFERVTLPLPPRYEPCTRPELDEPVELTALAIHGDYAYLAGACTAVLRVRRSDLCTSVIALEGREIETTTEALRGLSTENGKLTIAGPFGELFELDL